MPASNSPSLRRDSSADDAQASSDEVRMRLALEKLGTRSTPPVRSRPGSAAGAGHSTPRTRHKFARAERGGGRASTAPVKRKQVQDTPGVAGPQPAKWWLPLLQRDG